MLYDIFAPYLSLYDDENTLNFQPLKMQWDQKMIEFGN